MMNLDQSVFRDLGKHFLPTSMRQGCRIALFRPITIDKDNYGASTYLFMFHLLWMDRIYFFLISGLFISGTLLNINFCIRLDTRYPAYRI